MNLYREENAPSTAVMDHLLSSIESHPSSSRIAAMESTSPAQASWEVDSNATTHTCSSLFYDAAAGSIAAALGANNSNSPLDRLHDLGALDGGKALLESKRNTSSSSSSSSTAKFSTDPQSIAARMRRKRISERFKALQRLVPGGSKMDTASMLDEAISYVKFLKHQIWLHEIAIASSGSDASSTGFISNLVNSASSTGIQHDPFPPQLWN